MSRHESEGRSQGSGVRRQEAGGRRQGSEVPSEIRYADLRYFTRQAGGRSQGAEVRDQRSEISDQRSEVRLRMSDVRCRIWEKKKSGINLDCLVEVVKRLGVVEVVVHKTGWASA